MDCLQKEMERIFSDFVNESVYSGVCLITQGENSLFEKCVGMAHRGFQIPNTIHTMFDVASVTKIFTAAAILKLIETGKLSLNDRITDILDLSNTKISKEVTIEHLLTHTSGIADDAEEEKGESYSDLFIEKPNYAFRKLSDALPNFVFKEPNFGPGTQCMYNNCAYILLGLALEKLSAMDYKDYFHQHIFLPCGMVRTRFCAMDEVSDNVAENYIAIHNESNEVIGWRKNIYSYPPVGGTDGGIYTTAADLNRFIRDVQKILCKESNDKLFTPQCEFKKPFVRWKSELKATIRNGFGFEFVEIEDKIFCIRKDGINDGVSAMLSYYPDYDVVMVLLSNQCDNVWELLRRFQTVLYESRPYISKEEVI